jgi:Leucine-rich repeat (LRR) protein
LRPDNSHMTDAQVGKENAHCAMINWSVSFTSLAHHNSQRTHSASQILCYFISSIDSNSQSISTSVDPDSPDLFSEHRTNSTAIRVTYHTFKTVPDSSFLRFTNLQSLCLAYGTLTDVPTSLFTLQFLEIVDISNNALDFIPVEFGLVPSLRFLNIANNPAVTRPPLSELQLDQAALISFFRCIVGPRSPPAPRKFRNVRPDRFFR